MIAVDTYIEIGNTDIELIDGDRGKNYPHQNELRQEGDCVFLSANNVTTDGFKFDNVVYITAEKDRALRNGKIQRGDIVITTRGTVGNVAYYNQQIPYDNIRINSGMLIVRCHEQIKSEFLYYVLRGVEFQRQIKQIQTGTAQPQLPKSHFIKMKIIVPTIDVQEKIAKILRTIDEKIESNKCINENLCDQMKAIYLHAKKSSIWNECKLGEILTFYDHMRKPLSSRQREGMVRLYPYYGATSVVDYVDAYIFDGVYILISEDGANVVDALGHPLIQYTYGKFWVNNHAHIVQGNMFYSEALLFALLKTLNMSSIVTGAAQPKINQANLKDFCIVAPSNQEAMHLSNVLNPFLEQIIKNDLQNTILSNLRDTLLPRLMSGELDISNLDI